MANPAVMSSVCTCTFGAVPLPLMVSSQQTVKCMNLNVATIMDNKFPPFGMCSCPSNPAVIAATAAKLGVFSPAPCVPAIIAPWAPGVPTVLVCGKPLLNSTSKLMCTYGGVIQVTSTPAMTVKTP
jgi:hypothetical protein